MSEEYGANFITVTDEEGNEFELEHLDTIEFQGQTYLAFFPAVQDGEEAQNEEEMGLVMTAYDLILTSTILCKDPETGAYKVTQNLYGAENRVWVDIEEIPKNLQNAAVAIEDKRFYKHNGVDWVRTAKAVSLMFTGKDIQGGSTLTQQLIKNMTSDNEVTVKRKIMEIFRALEFEKKYSKEDILEA